MDSKSDDFQKGMNAVDLFRFQTFIACELIFVFFLFLGFNSTHVNLCPSESARLYQTLFTLLTVVIVASQNMSVRHQAVLLELMDRYINLVS